MKMERYGVRRVENKWLNSHLQLTAIGKIGQTKSVCLNITCVVPQGSVLGTKLFTVYSRDIRRVTTY